MRSIKYIITTIILVFVQVIVMAQPLPPSAPSGNPVPVDGFLMVMVAALTGMGVVKLRKKK
jgi:hypothetical protein